MVFPLHRRRLVLGVALVLASMAVTSLAAAQSVRAVVLPKQSVGGKAQRNAAFEAKVAGALQAVGMRVVDLNAALSAQRFAFSDAVQAGKIPTELSVLNADVAASVQLDCSRSSGGVMGSKINAYYCVLSTKVVRIDSGDTIFAETADWTGHGLNALMAVQGVLNKRVEPAVKEAAARWSTKLSAGGPWEIDLAIVDVADRRTARALATAIAELPGVGAARLLVFKKGLVKIVASGEGADALEGLSEALEGDPRLALTVTYETPRVLHAQYDYGKAFRRATMAMVVVDGKASVRAVAPDLMVAALSNLDYLGLAHTRPLLSSPARQSAMERRLRSKASHIKVPLYTVISLASQSDGWTATLKSSDVRSAKVIAAAKADASSVGEAIDAAVRRFDRNYRKALADAGTRRGLGLEAGAATIARDRGLVVNAFRLPRSPSGGEKPSRQAQLELVNRSRQVVRKASLTLRAGDLRLGEFDVPDLKPGASITLPVPLGQVPLQGDEYLQVTAQVRYRVGETYRKVSAHAPLYTGSVAKQVRAPKGYAEIIRVAVARFNEGEWVEARELFKKSHDIYPNARTLRALGMVEFDMGNYRKAVSYLRKSLDAGENPLTPALRQRVADLLKLARAHSS